MAQTRPINPKDSELITKLHAISAKSPKLIKSSVYAAPADPSINVRSWKMNEFKYYDVPSPFPTLARGIFTVEEPTTSDSPKQYRIVARGYDKFFNIGEVPWTTWPALELHTAAPYTLSLKSNGCIIFIGALTPTKLLITSKHSIGPIAGVPRSHAQVGEEWLRRYLEEQGKTEADLASRLYENSWTAISELCDDSFEEHVLPYPPELTGLHLHGLNECTREFTTLPHSVVDAFAEEWGFIKTRSIQLPSISKVREFTDQVALSGKWEGEAVEGFVVRTHVADPPATSDPVIAGKSATPYPPGSTFFFKVKFDEPYMMYRDWREVTKSLLSSHAKGLPLSPGNLPKSKMKRAETKAYVNWVIHEIKTRPLAFEGFSKGKGIVATRERFLKSLESGEADLNEEGEGSVEKGKEKEVREFGQTIIVPVAVPGCGKTTIALTLARLFGFGHTQSDDVHVKKAAPVFIKNVTKLLSKHNVVIADKNNHLKQHRTALRSILPPSGPAAKPIRLLAIDWSRSVASLPRATTHRICADRILSRGSNHQTLLADEKGKAHEEVVWMFIDGIEELEEGEVDEVIEMDLLGSGGGGSDGAVSAEEGGGGMGMEESVMRAAEGVCRVLGTQMPSEDRVKEVLAEVRAMQVKNKKPIPANEGKRQQQEGSQGGARYFALLPETDLEELLEPVFSPIASAAVDKTFWNALKAAHRITKRPHITLVHRNSLKPDPKSNTTSDDGTIEDLKGLWDRCKQIHELARVPPSFEMVLGSVVWDQRVMAVTVEDVRVALPPTAAAAAAISAPSSSTTPDTGIVVVPSQGDATEELAREFVRLLPEDAKTRLHITVGVRDSKVLAVDAKALVEAWRKGEKTSPGADGGPINEAKLSSSEGEDGAVIVRGRVRGLFS